MRARSSSAVGNPRSLREKGIAVAITAATLTFVVPAVGLAIDAGMVYGVRPACRRLPMPERSRLRDPSPVV
jgi:hypothetical protein